MGYRKSNLEGNFIFMCKKNTKKNTTLIVFLKILKPNCKIIELDHITEGAACTTLFCKKIY